MKKKEETIAIKSNDRFKCNKNIDPYNEIATRD